MNRHERRKQSKTLDQIDEMCDIQVDAKIGQIVMIFANAKGRKTVEDLWPDVKWTSDEKFASCHPPDWLFTHIRVTKLPSHLEQTVTLALCEPDALGFAVAMALQRRAESRRVVHYTGEGKGLQVNFYDRPKHDSSRELLAEYVPAGTPVGTPLSGTA